MKEHDEEDNAVSFFVIAAAAAAAISLPQQKQERKTKYIRDRMEWLRHVKELEEASPTSFLQLYRMSHLSFCRLLNMICPAISACLLYTSPSPRDLSTSRMPSSA